MILYLRNNFQEFLLYPRSKCFLHEKPLICIYCNNTREYLQFYCCLLPNLMILFLGSFLSGTLLKYGFHTCTVAALLSLASIHHLKFHFLQSYFFLSSEALFLSSDFDIFMIKLVLSSKFVMSFSSLLDILYKIALSTTVFLNAMTLMIRKR